MTVTRISPNVAMHCGICNKKIAKNQRAIKCSCCEKSLHLKCNKFDTTDLKHIQDHETVDYCINCIAENLPFSKLNNNEFSALIKFGVLNANEENTDFEPLAYQKELFDRLNTAINNNAFDLDVEDNDDNDKGSPSINCNYYTTEDFISARFNPSRTFSILHYNIHSVERHIEEFRVVLEMLDFTFDVICLSESKILKHSLPKVNININGYQTPVGTPTESTKGGVLMYVKNGINFKPRMDLQMYKPKQLESFFIEICNKNETNDIVGVIYRHPCMSESQFNDEFLKCLLDKISDLNKKVFIAGDFNFDLLNVSLHNDTFDFFSTMMSNLFIPVISIPTKINRINNTLIDNIFTNHIHPDIKSGNLTINLSDGHLPSFMIIPKPNQNHLPKKHNLFTRYTRNFNKENFISDYLSVNWDEIINVSINDVNVALQNFLNKFNAILDKHMPWRKITRREYKQRYKPWISNHILDRISNKNILLKKIFKCKTESRKVELYEQFKAIKNEITHSIRTSKRAYYKKYFKDNKNNLRKLWKGIKELVNIKSKNYDSPTCIQVNNVNITDPTVISNSFNDYFTSIADDILKQRKYNGTKSHRDFLPAQQLLENFHFEECDEREIESIISFLKENKSSGPHSIPTHILKLLKDKISIPLKNIFNLSLSSGRHPDILKIAKTVPIYKKGSRIVISNYRPISLLSNLNKILEKLVHSRLSNFLECHQCIYPSQFGFRKKHSTDHALIEITESIRQALDNKKIACGIFIDLQKAFDTVNHEILIDKLEHYCIRGIENDWFASYLNNRLQFVSVLGIESHAKPINHGVPQGSVLGPLLFIIYINDLHLAIHNSKVHHFADDTNLLNIGTSPKKMEKLINADLNNVYKWLLANKISLNCDKTEVMIFHKPGNKAPELKLRLNGHRIFPTKKLKYLGIYLDETLTFSYNSEILAKTLKRAIGILSKARHYLEKNDLKMLYYAIFSSHLSYGCQIWGQNQNIYNNKILTLQNKALRIISFSHFRADCDPIYYRFNILKLKDQIKLRNCLFIYDTLTKTTPLPFQNYFKLTKDVHSVETKSATSSRLYVTSINTSRYGLYSKTRKSIIDWNSLSKSLSFDLTIPRSELKAIITSHFLQSYL